MTQRILKINKLIKQELGKIIFTDVDFPKNIILTITKVDTSADLRYADVFISVLPDEMNIEIKRELKENIYFIQGKLNKKLHMKPLPRIRFMIDKSGEYVEKIGKLIEENKL
ncbi:30S ribosome-binding factor RbfA [Candidatus Parcubacteria bacterium]|nr:30S ribosome-binding factor RbfA [Candidatus Parcubacteria bacterium]